eukprot:4602893-Prorocentrum_lima.AAC.1
MADVRAAGPVVRRRVNRKRAARDGEYVEVGGSVEGGGADGTGGVRMRAYTIVVKAAVHRLRRE